MNPNDNIFNILAREAAYGPKTEIYVVAGSTIQFSSASPEARVACEKAQKDKDLSSATHLIAMHYNLLGNAADRPVFTNPCSGVIDVDGIVVSFDVRRIDNRENGEVYRLLFSRIDSAQMYRDLTGRVAALEASVEKLAKTGD